jgi:hypothetical protein
MLGHGDGFPPGHSAEPPSQGPMIPTRRRKAARRIVHATFRNLYDQFNMAAFIRERRTHAMSVLRWTLILVPMAAAVGTLCAAFLWSLDAVTRLRYAFPGCSTCCRSAGSWSDCSTI